MPIYEYRCQDCGSVTEVMPSLPGTESDQDDLVTRGCSDGVIRRQGKDLLRKRRAL
jgi:putative FmdB family regulatory protein